MGQKPDNRAEKSPGQKQTDNIRPEKTLGAPDEADKQKKKSSEAKPKDRPEHGPECLTVPLRTAEKTAERLAAYTGTCRGQESLARAHRFSGWGVGHEPQVMPGILPS